MAKVLIVDDDQAVRLIFKAIMANRGHASVAAGSVKQALELIEQQAFDLIITDLHMEPTGGMELLREVKGRVPAIPVVIVTSDSSINSTIEALLAGVSEYVIKPFRVEELIEVVDRALGSGNSSVDTPGEPRFRRTQKADYFVSPLANSSASRL